MEGARSRRNFRVSLGILAHNEAPRIAATLASLVEQTIVVGAIDECTALEIICVANGCSDDTASVSRLFFEDWGADHRARKKLTWRVVEVAESGKSNAWNLFVHALSDPKADYLFLMDADIRFLETDTLERMIGALEDRPSACVAVDMPIKDIALKPRKSLRDRLSLGVSVTDGRGHATICGQLYCGRASSLRAVIMPRGLPVEDGFLRAMVVTRGFTVREEYERVVLAAGTRHIFIAYTRFSEIFRHERRLMIGTVLNALLFDDLWRNATPSHDAGSLIRERNTRDPAWLATYLRDAVARRGRWVIPSRILLRRFDRLRSLGPRAAMGRVPSALVGFVLDLAVAFAANRALRTGSAVGSW